MKNLSYVHVDFLCSFFIYSIRVFVDAKQDYEEVETHTTCLNV